MLPQIFQKKIDVLRLILGALVVSSKREASQTLFYLGCEGMVEGGGLVWNFSLLRVHYIPLLSTSLMRLGGISGFPPK